VSTRYPPDFCSDICGASDVDFKGMRSFAEFILGPLRAWQIFIGEIGSTTFFNERARDRGTKSARSARHERYPSPQI
jgi:hypothetical protein